MRGAWSAALALLVASLAVPATAQATADPPLLTDGSNDAALTVQGSPAGDASVVYSGIDLVSLSIVEDPQELTWLLKLADLKPGNQDPAADGLRWQITFGHNGRFFRIDVSRQLAAAGEGLYMMVSMRDAPTGQWTYLYGDNDRVDADPDTDTVTVRLPRLMLADAKGALPYPGRTLDDVRVRGTSANSGGFISLDGDDFDGPVQVIDHMPAPDAPPVAYAVDIGLKQSGSARLYAPSPYRASNGEATTFVFETFAVNVGPAAETFTLHVVGAPARLAIVLPVPVVTLEPQQTHAVPVLVTVPFAHDHGSQDDFVLEMRGETPDSVGRLQMGVSYLAVPQPAGHHDTVYFHTRTLPAYGTTYEVGYMNTLEEDPDDADARFYPNEQVVLGLIFDTWDVSLGPALQMGLDFDLGRTARLRFTMATTIPVAQATLEGFLGVFGGQNGAMIAQVPETGPFDLLPNQPKAIEIDLPISAEADRLPYAPGSNLRLMLNMRSAGTASTSADAGPYIEPGGFLQLPLFEYHDTVDTVLSSLGGPGLSPLGAQERLVNPGKAVVFPVSIANPADEPRTYHLEVSGPNSAWASLPEAKVEVGAHATASASLIVRAPADAVDGDRADLVLQAYSSKDPAVRGLLRLVAEADTEATHADDTETADELSKPKESPGLALSLLAVALLGLARRRR